MLSYFRLSGDAPVFPECSKRGRVGFIPPGYVVYQFRTTSLLRNSINVRRVHPRVKTYAINYVNDNILVMPSLNSSLKHKIFIN